MTYELAKQLKDAGYPQDKGQRIISNKKPSGYSELMELNNEPIIPTLSELIEACGDDLFAIYHDKRGWEVEGFNCKVNYFETLEIAVALLWLELNKK